MWLLIILKNTNVPISTTDWPVQGKKIQRFEMMVLIELIILVILVVIVLLATGLWRKKTPPTDE
jgi:hypothetical protein